MSRSSITLSIATWIRSARSGSSLIATMPRWLRGISPKWIVSGSPRVRPSATFIGSTSPIRSATEVSGVASFSAYRSSRWRHDTGRSSPSCVGPPSRLRRDRVVGVLAELAALDHGRPLVQQPHQRAQQPGLPLPPLAEQDDVVPGDERTLELGYDGGVEAVQAGPGILARRPAWPAGWRGSPRAATGARARSRGARGRWRWWVRSSGIPERSHNHATHAHNVERARSRSRSSAPRLDSHGRRSLTGFRDGRQRDLLNQRCSSVVEPYRWSSSERRPPVVEP